ncbi:hypothetical protein Tco_0904719 [Tanacetum coccineum]
MIILVKNEHFVRFYGWIRVTLAILHTLLSTSVSPTLHAINDDSIQSLPRADLLLIGCDLAPFFLSSFEYALQPPSRYKDVYIAVDKPELPSSVSELKQYDGPNVFLSRETMLDSMYSILCVHMSQELVGWMVNASKEELLCFAITQGISMSFPCDINVYRFKLFGALIKEKIGVDFANVVLMLLSNN